MASFDQSAPSYEDFAALGPVWDRRGRPAGENGPAAVAADKAYCCRANRAYLRTRGIKAVISEKKDQAANRKKKGCRGGRPLTHDTDLYKDRDTVERVINKLKAWRGHRNPLRQDSREPRCRTPPSGFDGLARRPRSGNRMITTSHSP